MEGEEDELPMAECEGRGRGRTQQTPFCAVCGENTGHFMKDCKYNKMARELKEKDEAARSNKTSNHVFHNTSHEMVNSQGYGSQYMATSSSSFHHPNFSHGYNQHPYIWQQPPLLVYKHFA